MADAKTFSEEEHLAILADRVSKETASLTAERDQLLSEKAELQNQLDVAESAQQAAELRAETAEKAHEDFKAEIAQREEAAARKEERLKQLRESASHLEDAFFEDEKRIERIIAMADEDFTAYAADLAASGKAVAGSPGVTAVPRETAMAGGQAGSKPVQSSAVPFLFRGLGMEG